MTLKAKAQKVDKRGGSKRAVRFALLGTAVVLAVLLAVYLYPILFAPELILSGDRGQPASSADAAHNPIFGGNENELYLSPVPTQVPEVSAAPSNNVDEPTPPAGDTAAPFSGDVVNILLIGVDEEFKSYSRDYHSDTMIVLAVNFMQKRADMISLRRDTFCHVPGVRGVYKLNAALNVGGGLYAEGGAGFLKVCEAAEMMLGGLAVDYYYAVQLEAVVELVDMIGGVDYNVDIVYGNLKMGRQHLDGRQVLTYMRARKEMQAGAGGDINRVDRQKRMLIAIFAKMREQGLLKLAPDLIAQVNEGLFTNVSTRQTLALAKFAMELDMNDIGTYSFDGPMHMSLGWAFCFPDEDYRVRLIEKLYGVRIEKREYCSYEYSKWLGEQGFSAVKRIRNAERVAEHARNAGLATDDSYLSLQKHYSTAVNAYELCAKSLTGEDRAKLKLALTRLGDATQALARLSGFSETLRNNALPDWTADGDINEVYVDFR